MAKRILVTGGAGFIGSHLCERLVKKENKVTCIDNFVTGSKENIKELMENDLFELIEADICNKSDLEKPFSQIYNLASIASPLDYQEKPIETLMVGSVGVKQILDLALKNKSRFLHTSTSEVYGDPLEHPQREDYWGNVNPIGIRSCYDESKRFAESLVMTYNRVHKLDTRIARIFNTYGPRMQQEDGRAVPNFITQALNGEPITVYGDGEQTRSFCFISDMVQGLINLMNSSFIEPVNLGNPNEMKLIDLAEKVKQLTKSNSEIVFEELPSDDPKQRKPDISRAEKELNWKPVVSLEEGLKQTISYFGTRLE
ncbi:MAG: UDP-glucuronic acid decarboxylase family protein [archaeon]